MFRFVATVDANPNPYAPPRYGRRRHSFSCATPSGHHTARGGSLTRSALAASAPKGSQEALGFQAAKHTLRAAIEDDLDDAVNVYTDAFKHGRTWQYGYLHDD
ncbi:hypothetical protein LTS02_018221, partial [Friedmanniomyces endolithicus]